MCRDTGGIAGGGIRVHNGPTVFYKLLKEPPCQAVFLCLRFRLPSAIRAGFEVLQLPQELLFHPALFRAG